MLIFLNEMGEPMTTSSQHLNRSVLSFLISVFIVLFVLVVFSGVEGAYAFYIPRRSETFNGDPTGKGFLFLVLAFMVLLYSLYNFIEYRNMSRRPKKKYYHPLKK